MSEASDDANIQTIQKVGDMTFEGLYNPAMDALRVQRIDPPRTSDEQLVHVRFDGEGRLVEVVQFKVKETGLSIGGIPTRLGVEDAGAAPPPPGPDLDEQLEDASKRAAGTHAAVMNALQPMMPPNPQF
jgi:hypothetical protein